MRREERKMEKGRKYKAIVRIFVMGCLLCLCLCSCSVRENGQESLSESDREGTSLETGSRNPGEEGEEQSPGQMASIDQEKLLNQPWEDNTLDCYLAEQNLCLYQEKTREGWNSNTRAATLGGQAASCYVISFQEPEDLELVETEDGNWVSTKEVESQYELLRADKTGRQSSDFLEKDQLPSGIPDFLGYMPGTYHLMMCHTFLSGEEKYDTLLAELDEELTVIRETRWQCFSEDKLSQIRQIMVDSQGYYHVITQGEAGKEYYSIVTWEGELLAEPILLESQRAGTDDSSLIRLVSLPDGRIALQTSPGTNTLRLSAYSPDCSQLEEIASLEKSFAHNLYLTLGNDGAGLFADSAGIHTADPDGESPRTLYRWKNHGITVQRILQMKAGEDDTIQVLYMDGGDINYLVLAPTTFQREICQMEIAAGSYMKETYQIVAKEFNRRFPAFHIEVVDQYDNTRLLTELVAGDGPVLIDTLLLGSAFYDQEKLWEPLDGVLEQLELTDELYAKAMEGGRIQGTLYGVVPSFSLETVITADHSLQDWNYDTFLQSLEEKEGLERIAGGYYGEKFPLMMSFFVRETGDNYLFDADEKTTIFRTEKFQKLLDLQDKYTPEYTREDWAQTPEKVLEGKIFCQTVRILKPTDVTLTRIEYGEDINYIGYPSRDGARHLIHATEPLTVRRSASFREKEGAFLFLKLLLSGECQLAASRTINFPLSVRKDVLEEQLSGVTGNTFLSDGIYNGEVGEAYAPEKDRAIFYGLLEKAQLGNYLPRELLEILSGELDGYYEGQISRESLIDRLDNRVRLYLEEQ